MHDRIDLRRSRAWMLALLMLAGAAGACRDGAGERYGEDVDDAVEDVEDVAEDVGDKAEDVVDETEDALDDPNH